MYCYKLNNSYTVYVNFHYLNECRKMCKKTESASCVKTKKPAQRTVYSIPQNKGCGTVSGVKNAVKFGSVVQLINVETQQTYTWTLVHPDGIDLTNKQLSVESPVGKALMGHYIGECVSIKIPAGLVKYQILDLKN